MDGPRMRDGRGGTSEKRVRVAVVGAGAVGSLVGGLLARAGEEVVLVGRRAHVEAIESRGLLLEGLGGGPLRVRVAARERLEERPEVLLLAVKSQDLERACREVAPLAREAVVVTMQNGLRCDGIARHFFRPDQIVGCVVYSMATFLEPGRVECGVRGWLCIGDPFIPDRPRLARLRALLRQALPVRISRDIAATRRTKLVGNLNNALPAATGRPLQEIYFSPTTGRLPLRVMREGFETLEAAGLETDRSPQALALGLLSRRMPEGAALALLRAFSRTPPGRRPVLGSTYQSVVRGSPTEVDFLNGEIVALGQRAGVPTPYNAHLVRLVHEVERGGGFFPPEALWPEDTCG
ncbi:hypothetical protein Rxycam_02460 [Rubrobacter xylanophilus DSM 9941]|nr:hypothetical protein Rxycam_02460 [Rubrobacter xylanophilus DSM 9941]